MATTANPRPDPLAGTARLPVVVPVAVLSFFYTNLLDYALPLYFGARTEAAKTQDGEFPLGVWSALVKYQVTPWIAGPLLAGLLARRYGERVVWSGALLGNVAVPLALVFHPHPAVITGLAFWQGLTGALMWIAGISLVQAVAPGRKGLANGLMMASMGLGSLLAPLAGRLLLYRQELGTELASGNWGSGLNLLLHLSRPGTTPKLLDFELIFWLLATTLLASGPLVYCWGQRPGRFEGDEAADWRQTAQNFQSLLREPRFWALTLTLCVLGGPVFQASNQFLPYRAEELGLKSLANDRGWIWLKLLQPLMWIPGGVAVGMIAGRRAPGVAAVLMLASFAGAALGIGESWMAWQLFAWVAVFEFVRQFMRWSHAGYLSEHLPAELRATAIGSAITLSGVGSTVYAWSAGSLWDPDVAGFQSSKPFVAAAVLGLVGSVALLVFDRLAPIRQTLFTKHKDEAMAHPVAEVSQDL